MTRASGAFLLLAVSACNVALRDAMQRAEAAHARGDHFGEAVALRDACSSAPSEKEICAAAKEAANEIITRQLQTAAGPCQTEPTACLAALEVLTPFADPNDPRLSPYFERAGQMLYERCERAPLDSPEDAVFHVRCAEAYRKRVPTPGYATLVSQIRQRAGAFMDQTAMSQAASPGVAWLYESLAGCLGGQAAYHPRVESYHAAFGDAHAVRLLATGRAPFDLAELCRQVTGAVGSIMRCDGRTGSLLRANVDAWVEPMLDSPVREVRQVDVLDHTERWDNPDYRFALSNVRHARNRFDEAVNQARLARSDCDTAESALSRARYCYNCYERSEEERACNRKRATEDIEGRCRRELGDYERILSNTPAVLTREVYRTVSYRNVEHRFRVPWHVRLSLGDGAPIERSGALSFESTERDGVPAANIDFLPYSEPTQEQRRASLWKMTFDHFKSLVSEELDRRAQATLAACPAPDQVSDCQVEAALLSRQDPVGQFVADVGARLDGRTDRPWPKASCAP
jgi:hypothetical protein